MRNQSDQETSVLQLGVTGKISHKHAGLDVALKAALERAVRPADLADAGDHPAALLDDRCRRLRVWMEHSVPVDLPFAQSLMST